MNDGPCGFGPAWLEGRAGEGLEDRASLDGPVALAGPHEGRDRGAQARELRELLVDHRELLPSLLAHGRAWRPGARAEPQELGHVGQGEPERFRATDEPEALLGLGAEAPVSGLRAARGLEQPQTLVVAQRIDGDARSPRELSDAHRSCGLDHASSMHPGAHSRVKPRERVRGPKPLSRDARAAW